MAFTYSDLYTLVYEEIQKNSQYAGPLTGNQQVSKDQVISGVSTTTAQSIIDAANITNSLMQLMLHTVPPQIKTGLTVKATDPVSNQVVISAGEGTVGGRIFKLPTDRTYVVPFDPETYIWYVNFSTNGIVFSKAPMIGRLTIAKIVVPKPAITVYVRDDKDLELNPWHAWIVNYREYKLYGNDAGKFEEDTLQLLRDNIGDILADNIIGNIRLSEDLKITNTQGTLELDSQAIRILDTDANNLAEFNRYGTFFYDTNGIELAKFSVDGARVGNIEVTKNSIQSQNFTSNLSGFRITDDGYAEFEDARIRGVLKATVFEKETVSAVGGQLIVANAATLVSNLAATDTTMVVDNEAFNLGEVLIIKDAGTEEYLKITSAVSAPTYTIERNLKGSGYSAQDWNKGTTVVSTGEAGEGYLILDATSNYAPFLDIIARDSDVWDDISLKVRLGNLAGVVDPEFGQLSGYGLYSDNAYLKGNLFALGIKTAISGSRIDMNTERFFAYDDNENLLFQIFMDDVHPSGVTPGEGWGDLGDMYFGDYVNNQGLFWDKSTATLWIRGLLDASDVTIGNLSVSFLSGGTMGGSGNPVEMEVDTNSIMKSFRFLDIAGPEYGWAFYGDGSFKVTMPGSVSGVDAGYMESENFVANTQGWRLYGDGRIDIYEYNNLEDLNDVTYTSPGPVEWESLMWNGSEWTNKLTHAVYA